MKKRQEIRNRKFVFGLLCLNCFTISFNVAAIEAAIPSIARDLQLPIFAVSRIIPAYLIPYGLGALIYAPLARYINFRMLMTVTMAVFAVSNFLCAQATDVGYFFLPRLLTGIVGSAAIPLGLILIGKMFEKDVRGRLVGLFFGFSFVASIVGVALSGVADWRWLFYLPSALGLIAAIAAFGVPSADLDAKEKNPVNYLNLIYNNKIRNIFIFIFIISSLYYGVHKWFGVYLSRVYELNQLTISSFFVLTAVMGFSGQILGGYVSDKKGRVLACLVGIIILGAASALLVGKYPLGMLAVILSLTAMGWSIGHNGASTVLTDFPEENRAEVASLNSAVRFLAGGLGFVVSAPFVQKSFSMTFFVLGILILVLSFFVKKAVPLDTKG
ncbi:MAG TPA: MFS transporter [Candidatus Omnitrophota bacterium]|nr:MFS transporter [Candidatus Omnitrophota bacterium]HQL41268.1 MFS transporter [Candidatus Omnitrophota bacterium]